MSFSKVNNFNIAMMQNGLPSKNLRSFKAAESSDNLPSDVVDENQPIQPLSNDEIYAISSYLPDKKMSQVAAKTMKTLLVTIPVLDTAASAIFKKGNLSAKLKAGANSAGKWGAVFAAGLAVSQIKNVVNSRVEPLDKFDKKHPFLSTIIDFSAIYAAFDSVNKSAGLLNSKFKSSFPRFANKLDAKVFQPAKEALNNSFVNKKIVMPAEKFVAKRPYLGVASKISAYVLVPAMFVASYVRYGKELHNRNVQVENNINILSAMNNAIVANLHDKEE